MPFSRQPGGRLGKGGSATGISEALPEHAQDRPAANRMSVQLRDFEAAVAALPFPAPMRAACKAVEELGGLYVAIFDVAIGLRVVAKCTKCRAHGADARCDARRGSKVDASRWPRARKPAALSRAPRTR